MRSMKYSAEEEQALMSSVWSPMIADDPEAFVMLAVHGCGSAGCLGRSATTSARTRA
jgi:hypothetical protein